MFAQWTSSTLQGIDSFGVDLTYKPSLQFDSMGRKLPLSRLTSIEFKSTFRVPDTAPKDTKSGRCYNHSFILTDQLVCWDMAWNKDHQVCSTLMPLSSLTPLASSWSCQGSTLHCQANNIIAQSLLAHLPAYHMLSVLLADQSLQHSCYNKT